MRSITAHTAEHHRRLGLTEGVVAEWEDGLRTDPERESFEWWYLDGALSDGSKLTVEFHTKPPYVSPSQPLTPFISFTLDRPDGTNVSRTLVAAAEDFTASSDRCDVRIAENTFAGDLRTYRIHVAIEGVVADLELRSQVPAWRPATGHALFGDKLVAWLPAVPRGTLSGTISVDGVEEAVDGVGYHDHNWGTAPLRKLVDHWYWGRARIGDYTVVTLAFTSNAEYGRVHHPAFMVARGSEIIAAGERDVEFAASDVHPHPATGALVADHVRYAYEGDDATYVVCFDRERDVFTLDLGKAGAYHRFVGAVTLERRVGDELLERVTDDALWELLDFRPRAGSAAEPIVAERGLAHRV
jgi:hypothetical protein